MNAITYDSKMKKERESSKDNDFVSHAQGWLVLTALGLVALLVPLFGISKLVG